MAYLLDSNVFIEAHNSYYSFDFHQAFWNKLLEQAEEGEVISIDEVKDELMEFEDELSDWVSNSFSFAFYSVDDPDVIQQYGRIMNWAEDEDQFLDYAKKDFADDTDAWVVAYAVAYNHTVVTHETYEPDIKNEIKIPNVCEEFDVPYCDTFEMLRNLDMEI